MYTDPSTEIIGVHRVHRVLNFGFSFQGCSVQSSGFRIQGLGLQGLGKST